MNFVKGLINATLISIAIWAIIIGVIKWIL